jgi:hypothetical protein
MKRNPLTGLLLLPLLGLGCSTMNNTEKGALVGGGLGAGVGALAGSTVHAPGAGALIGGAVGALAGGVAGSDVDRAEARERAAVQQAAAAQAAAAQPQAPSPSLQDIMSMNQSGTHEQVIINAIRVSPGPYILSAQQIVWLQEQGISARIISEMQSHGPAAAPVVYQQAPPPPVYVVRPRPSYVIYGR